MKYILMVLLLLVSAGEAISSSNEMITLRRIRLRINDERYLWEDSKLVPERSVESTQLGSSAPVTVLSFVDAAPGDRLTVAQLERKVIHAQFRLNKSGFFNTAGVHIVPPREPTEYRTITIMVEDGFRKRFGGGAVFGYIGRVNAAGLRRYWGIHAGLTAIQAQYRDELFLGSNTTVELGAGYTNMSFIGDGGGSVHGTFKAGYRIHPDNVVSAGITLHHLLCSEGASNYLHPMLEVSGTGLMSIDDSSSLILPYSLSLWNLMSFGKEMPILGFSSEAGLRGRYGHLDTFLHIALQGASSTLPDHFQQDFSQSTGMSVRGAYSKEELSASSYVWVGAKASHVLTQVVFPPLIRINIAPMVFAEAALIDPSGFMHQGYLREAAGIGLVLCFDRPVFVRAELTAGVNRRGTWRMALQITSDM